MIRLALAGGGVGAAFFAAGVVGTARLPSSSSEAAAGRTCEVLFGRFSCA